MTFEDLKIFLIKKKITFRNIVSIDGRSYQYLHKECTKNNQKVLIKLFEIAKNF